MQSSLAKTFRWPTAITILACVVGGLIGGPKIALLIALLCILEISISFDNAIVNATVLKNMSAFWQKLFLTVGILIAVFGMRLVFPIVIVALAAGISIPDVVNLAINDQEGYAAQLAESNAIIAAFGGTFLLLVFLGFFFDEDKDIHWVHPVERLMTWSAKVGGLPVVIALGALLVVSQIVAADVATDVLVAGIAGIVIHEIISGLADALAPADIAEDGTEPTEKGKSSGQAATELVGKAGFAAFLYLEVLDASFSFDGVIGAFAISQNIFIIAAGLGVGALFIRSMTVYLVRAGTLNEYRFLEHGAHWAIGALAILLLVGTEWHPPEIVTGLLGAGLIGASFVASLVHNRRDRTAAAAESSAGAEVG